DGRSSRLDGAEKLTALPEEEHHVQRAPNSVQQPSHGDNSGPRASRPGPVSRAHGIDLYWKKEHINSLIH
ncbi:hypothetical protein VIGAN_07245300, partial [Vigna angularis var. angularis]